MSSAVPGHGYRESLIVTPWCKCGWRGATQRDGDEVGAAERARREFENHKHSVRQATGYQTPLDRRVAEIAATERRRRQLRVVGP